MPTVLCVTYGGGHVAMVIPCVREMQRRGGWNPVVLGLTTAGPALREAGVAALGFSDLVQAGDEPALEIGRQLANAHHVSELGIPLEESVAYLGLCYADLQRRLGADQARCHFQQRQRHAFLPIGPMRRLIDQIRPDLVLATNSPKSERAALLAARELGVPAVCMVDLFAMEWDFMYDPTYADRMLLMSEAVRDDFLQRGYDAEKLVVTGNPAFDRLADPALLEAGLAWRSKQQLDAHRVLLWTATTAVSESQQNAVLQRLAEALRLHPDWRLIFRPHPSQAARRRDLPAGVLWGDPTIDVALHLHAADSVLVSISTTGLEAALLGKPVVKMCLTDPDYAPYQDMGIALPVADLNHIEAALAVSLERNAETHRLAEARRRLPVVGQAAGRAVDALEAAVSDLGPGMAKAVAVNSPARH